MRHNIILLIMLLALSPAVSAQVTYDEEHSGENFTLDKPLYNGKSHHYTASGRIDFKKGFTYKPAKGKRADFEVDPMMVFPPEGGMTGGPIAGDGGVVGAIGGTVNVSALGGAVYTIPIQLPSGKDGMQPTLGVTYNSQAGNGLLGYGWNLTGLSSISRCGRTIYHDKLMTGDAVDYQNDRFSLDGQRLLSISDGKTYGQDGCEYRTEVDNISRIISYGGDGQNPLSFKVWTKDGHIIEYGCTTDSRLMHGNSGKVAMWMVNKISDYNGNYVIYHYTTTGESCRIDHIDYTGSDNVSPMYSVTFSYEGRDDKEFAYLYNQRIVSDVLLDNISVKYKATSEELCKYTFTYDGLKPSEGRFYSRLLSVGLEHDGASVNPTKIEWYSCNDNIPYDVKLNGNAFNSVDGPDCFVGDFNGDGYDDFVKLSSDYQYSPNYDGRRYIRVLYNDRNGNFITSGNSGYEIVFNPEDYMELSIDTINKPVVAGVYPCELNGDGLCDILLLVGSCRLNITCLRFVSYICHKKTNGVGFSKYSEYDVRDNFDVVEDCVYPGDFLGKGVMDIIVKQHAEGYGDTFTWYECCDGRFVDNNVRVCSARHFENHFVGDFNGDGKNDLFCFDGTGYTIYTISEGDNGLEFKSLCSDVSGSLTSYHRLFSGDFNGDGKTDLISWKNNKWKVHYSKSDGFDTFAINQPDIPTSDPTEQCESLLNYTDVPYSIRIGDMNADGKSDIAFVHRKSVQVFFSPIEDDGTGQNTLHFKNSLSFDNHYNPSGAQKQLNYNRIGNFYGTDYLSLWLHLTDYTDKQIPPKYSMIDFRNQSKQNIVVFLTDGIGNKLGFEYEYLTRDDFCHTTPGLVSEHSLTRIQALPLRALKSYETRNVSNWSVKTKYEYTDPVLNLRGKGILGFMSSCVYDDMNGLKSEVANECYSDIPINAFLIPKSSATKLSVDGDYKTIKEVDYSYSLIKKPSNTNQIPFYLPQLDKVVTHNYDIDGAHKCNEIIEYSYDNDNGVYTYNNVRSVKKGYTTDESLTMADKCPFIEETETIYKDAVTDGGRWLVSRVEKSTTTTHIDTENHGVSGIKSSVEYDYNQSHPHLLKSERVNPGDNPSSELAVKTEYDYTFAGGNISKVTTTTSAPNDSELKQRTTTVEYSSDYQYRFATKTTDALGHSATAVYDPVYGRRLSDTDCNGLTDEYTTDFFGIDSESVSPDGTITHSSKRWSDGCDHAPENASYYTWVKGSGSYPAMTFYHKTGVALRSVTRGFDGEVIYVDMEYDAKGNLWRQSLPYEAGGSTDGYTVYTYDALNRVKRTDYPDGTWDEVTYSGNEVAATHHDASDKLSQTVTKKYHPNGWLESTTDADNNTVSYVYNSDGTLESASAGGQDMAVILTYNEAGMRKSIDDPDYGCMMYKYNAFGEVTKQTTPKGATTKFEYDVLGRQTRRAVKSAGNPEETTVWKYSSEEGRVGTLESVVFNGQQKISYQYDDLQRVTKREETFDGVKYESEYTYDVLGRLGTETYPSGVTVSNRYNEGGYLYAVKDNDGDILWKADGHDIHGHLTDFHTGNGLTTHHEYDDHTGRLLGITTRSEKNILQDYVYTYDDFGNFASRRKKIGKMPIDTFTYDNLNRLTVVETNGVPFRIEYDRHGRILTKEQEGFSFRNASFDKEHPHAVARVEAYRRPDFGGQEVTYTPFDKVETVTLDDNSLRIEYGYDRQRIRMTEVIGGEKRVKTYIGNCEFVHQSSGGDYVLTYLCAGGGIFAVAKTTDGGCRMHYVHTDHLGSWDIITDEDGTLEQELSFDAWGNRRNATTWQGAATDEPLFDRGFTGHEHLYAFGLINMNGRVYDPLMSMFLSPDNFIQSPDNSQNFNRYAYCMNNPLRYTDPSGEFWHIIIGAVIGGTVNLVANWNNCEGFWEYAAAFGVGAAAGAAVAATGGLSFGAAAGIAAAGSAATSATNSVIAQTGKNFAGMGNVNWGQVGLNAAVGAVSGFAGYGVGQLAATSIGGVFINGFNITSPVVKGVIGGAIGGAAGGYAGGFVGGYIMTGDLEEAKKAGLNGMWQGAIIGGVSGGIGGYAAAKSEGINPWTGVRENSVTIGEGMSRVESATHDLNNNNINDDWPKNMDAYYCKESREFVPEAMDFNGQWIDSQMKNNNYIYDIGTHGNSPITSPFYNMEVGRTMNYSNLINTKCYSYKIPNSTSTIRITIFKR